MMRVITCPFCGSRPKIEGQMVDTQFESYFISCSNEECEAAIKKPFLNKEDAIKAWNRRAEYSYCNAAEKDNTFFKGEKLNMEPILKLYDEVEKQFDRKAMWVVLFLLSQIDVETWTLPDYLHGGPFDKYLSLIEDNEELKNTFNSFKGDDNIETN